MREIKFRAWDTYQRIMVDDVVSNNNEMLNELFKDEAYIFMQYTGLKDKNGKEIYEGDILSGEDSNSDYPVYALVEWDEEYGRWDAMEHDVPANEVCEYELWSFLTEYTYVEHAGNIYENKDLLK